MQSNIGVYLLQPSKLCDIDAYIKMEKTYNPSLLKETVQDPAPMPKAWQKLCSYNFPENVFVSFYGNMFEMFAIIECMCYIYVMNKLGFVTSIFSYW
jgi:hypothetical protein